MYCDNTKLTNTFTTMNTNPADTQNHQTFTRPPMNTIDKLNTPSHQTFTLQVPLGTRIVYEKWCSTQFFIEVMGLTFPRWKGDDSLCSNLINPCYAYRFELLEAKYADRLWDAMKRRGRVGSLHFNFDKNDFSRTGLGTPRHVCQLFLCELCKESDVSLCKQSNGKFFGMHFDVWNNGAFTTHFTW